MRKLLLILWLTAFVTPVWADDYSSGWRVTGSSVKYVIVCPYNGSAYNWNYYEMGVTYSGGQWVANTYDGKPGMERPGHGLWAIHTG